MRVVHWGSTVCRFPLRRWREDLLKNIQDASLNAVERNQATRFPVGSDGGEPHVTEKEGYPAGLLQSIYSILTKLFFLSPHRRIFNDQMAAAPPHVALNPARPRILHSRIAFVSFHAEGAKTKREEVGKGGRLRVRAGGGASAGGRGRCDIRGLRGSQARKPQPQDAARRDKAGNRGRIHWEGLGDKDN